ncbi:hypothetical protein GCM10009128_08360 [Psychrosphaera haliotis]
MAKFTEPIRYAAIIVIKKSKDISSSTDEYTLEFALGLYSNKLHGI